MNEYNAYAVGIFRVKASCLRLVDGIKLWLLTSLVNEVAMLLVVCQLSRHLNEYILEEVRIGHLQVPKTLTFKIRPIAQPFL